jgi:hypothetical protein
VNCFYVPEPRVLDAAASHGYLVESAVGRRANTARVFVLRRSP